MASTSRKWAACCWRPARFTHRVYRIVEGTDDDWAGWYDWWLGLAPGITYVATFIVPRCTSSSTLTALSRPA